MADWDTLLFGGTIYETPINPPPAPGEGGWYSRLDPQPIDVIEAWELDYLEGTALKYLARWRHKGGVQDLEKCKFFIERLIAREQQGSEGVATGNDTGLSSDGPRRPVWSEPCDCGDCVRSDRLRDGSDGVAIHTSGGS